MNINDYRGKRGIWAFDWQYQAEQDGHAVINTLLSYGINLLVQEIRYGMEWQPGPAGEPKGFNDWKQFAQTCEAQGIQFDPLVLPRGLAGEAQDHGAIAASFGRVWVDFEYDPNDLDNEGRPRYWGAPPEMAKVYAQELREEAPDALIIWEPDGRIADPARAGEFNPFAVDIRPYIDAFSPQLYVGWTAYGATTQRLIQDENAFQKFASLGLPVMPTLWIAGPDIDRPTLLAQWAINNGALCNVGFRLGAADVPRLLAMQQWPVAMELPQPGPVEPAGQAPNIADFEQLVRDIGQDIINLTERHQHLLGMLQAWKGQD